MSDELLKRAKNWLSIQEAAVDYGNLPDGEKITMRANNMYLRDLIAEIERLREELAAANSEIGGLESLVEDLQEDLHDESE
jgi:predicted  nucleic acid-binding Zn-ribbon protein